MSEVVATAKIEMYRDGIEDLPAWAIDRAIKMWARSECPAAIEAKPNYNFPPSPAALRSMAIFYLDRPREDKRKLETLLAAMSIERALDPTPIEATPTVPSMRRM